MLEEKGVQIPANMLSYYEELIPQAKEFCHPVRYAVFEIMISSFKHFMLSREAEIHFNMGQRELAEKTEKRGIEMSKKRIDICTLIIRQSHENKVCVFLCEIVLNYQQIFRSQQLIKS